LRFWDSSALLPLVPEEATSRTLTGLLRGDHGITVWWGTWAECAVAISRIRRVGGLDDKREEDARDILDILAETWVEIRPEDDIRLLSTLLSKYYPLRTADCFQLAAALRWCEGGTAGMGFVCLDNRLRGAAQDEGFDVLPEAPKPA
jgi:uncharacterized protein